MLLLLLSLLKFLYGAHLHKFQYILMSFYLFSYTDIIRWGILDIDTVVNDDILH